MWDETGKPIRVAGSISDVTDKKRAVEVARTIQSDMARYLFTITCINGGLGVVTAIAMYFLGMPNPVLWFRPGSAAPLPVPAAHKVVGFNDQHCHMLVPDHSPLQVGDMVSFDVSHPCLTFDKWRVLYRIDDDYNVIAAIETYF